MAINLNAIYILKLDIITYRIIVSNGKAFHLES